MFCITTILMWLKWRWNFPIIYCKFQSLGSGDIHTRNIPSIALVVFSRHFCWMLDVLLVTLPNKKNQFGRSFQREKYLQFEMVENSEGKWKGGWWVLESVMKSKWTFVNEALFASKWQLSSLHFRDSLKTGKAKKSAMGKTCYLKSKSCLGPSNMDSELCSGHTITWATCQFLVPTRKYKYFFAPWKIQILHIRCKYFLTSYKIQTNFQ